MDTSPARGFVGACVAIALALASQACGQEIHWNDLHKRIADLTRQGQFREALPVAVEELKVARASFPGNDDRVAISLIAAADIYEKTEKYETAEQLYRQALNLRQRKFGAESAEAAEVLDKIAVLRNDQGSFDEAVTVYKRALGMQEKALGPKSAEVASTLGNLADLYDTQEKYAEAEPLFRRALEIDEKALGPDDPQIASILNALAGLYEDETRYAEAEPLYQRALSIREKALGPNHPDISEILIDMGQLDQDEDKYAEAEPLFQRALQIDEKAYGPVHHEVSADLFQLASLYDDQGRYALAESLYERALRIDEKVLGPDHPGITPTLSNLATLYQHEGKSAQAEPLLKRSIQIEAKVHGIESRARATDLIKLASVYDDEGKFGEAEKLYLEGLHIDQKVLGPEAADVSPDLADLGQLYFHEGRYAEAELSYEHALHIDEKAYGPEHTQVAIDLTELGLLWNRVGKYPQAETVLRRSLAIDEKALGPEHPEVAIDLANLAQLLDNEGKFAEAEPLYQRSLSIDEKALGPEHPSIALDLNNFALLKIHQGKYAEARPLYDRALRINEKVFGPEHPQVAINLGNLANMLDQQGRYVEAESYYARSFDSLFHQFQYHFTYMTEKQRLSFLDSISFRFPMYFSFVERFRHDDPLLVGSMYNLLLWEKGFVAGSVTNLRRSVEASGDDAALKLLQELSEKRSQLATLLSTNPPDRDAWRKQVDALHAEADDLETQLVARSGAFAQKQKLDRSTWQQVRDALKPEEAAVEFSSFRYYDKTWTSKVQYVALVVTRETRDQPEFIELGDGSQIEGDALKKFQRAVRTRGLRLDADEAALPGALAFELIWKPLEGTLSGKKRVYLALDGMLNKVPMGIIPSPDGSLQMERFDLRFLSSTKDILRDPHPHTALTALLIGDPNFDLTETQQMAAIEKLAAPHPESPVLLAENLPGDLTRDGGTGTSLPRLPGTGVEVTTIAGLMQAHQWKVTSFTGDLALKRAVEKADSPRVLHIATHGFFLPDRQGGKVPTSSDDRIGLATDDPMLRSGLYFAGADRALAGKPTMEGLDNGILTAMEASNLNLAGTELVVLSACNTGRGDLKTGEGVFGLRRALEEAGAQDVLMSLWSVPDKETRQLMKRFYAKWLDGVEIHEALKQAQLEMRTAVKTKHGGTDLPYFWGAFVLVGR